MTRFPPFIRRRFLALGIAAVLVPLVVLMLLQYRWLTRLQEMSVVAHRAALRGYLDAVGWEVQSRFRETAAVLELSPAAPRDGFRELLQKRWESTSIPGATRLFVMDFTREVFGNLLFYEPDSGKLVSPAASDEALAIIVTCNPWQLDVYRGDAAQDRGLVVDERDPERRMLLRPFLDENAHVLAIVGMILDESWFRGEFLPEVASRGVETHFPPSVRDQLTLCVRDGRGVEVLHLAGGGRGLHEDPDPAALNRHAGKNEGPQAATWSASMLLPFVYTDWSLAVETPGLDVERWARTGFLYNMTLSGVLALLLLGGVFLALRAANRAVRLSEMKSDFVSNVSHELRTPLASIRAFGELLRLYRGSPEKVREYGEHIEAESRRLSRLIDNILDFSRIESGGRTYRFERGSLAAAVTGVIDTFRVRTRERGFEIELAQPDESLPELDLDADAIGQVMHNLLDNAVKYSGQSRRIEIRLFREGEWLACAVVDHGIGIAPPEQQKVFERFHRVGTGLVHDVQGSGLGLSIVEHVVAAHGGRVDLVSEPGRGTTVTVRLPLPEENRA